MTTDTDLAELLKRNPSIDLKRLREMRAELERVGITLVTGGYSIEQGLGAQRDLTLKQRICASANRGW